MAQISSVGYVELFPLVLCIIGDSGKDKPGIASCDAVAPHFIGSAVGIRILQPLFNLLTAFGFALFSDSFVVGFKNILPPVNLCIGRIFRSQVITPPCGHTLEQCTFLWCKTADDVFYFRSAVIYDWRVFVIRCY